MCSRLTPRALLSWDATLHTRKSHSTSEWSGTETLPALGLFNGSLHPYLSPESTAGSPLTALVGTTWSTALVGLRVRVHGNPGWNLDEVKGASSFCKSTSAVNPFSHLEMLPSHSALRLISCNSIQIYDLVLGRVLLLPDWNNGQLTMGFSFCFFCVWLGFFSICICN